MAQRDRDVASPEMLVGFAPPWQGADAGILVGALVIAFWVRLVGLSAEGFADDEIHKWLAASRYLAGDFGGDDLEHPMLMKWLIAGAIALCPRSWAPETITRLPNAIAGGATVLAVALVGRRLLGRVAGLLSAGLSAVSTTLIGYQRTAKEDTLVTLFLVLLVWCLSEARAAAADARTRDARRWEHTGAVFLGLMLASKYFLVYALIPLLAYLSLRSGVPRWRIPLRRWVVLCGIALAVFLPLNFAILLPDTWSYLVSYAHQASLGDRWRSESLWFMGRPWANVGIRDGIPWWFYLVFSTVKLAPPTFVFACGGVALALWHRAPAHRILLVWIATWFAIFVIAVAKYGRFFLAVHPALLLLASHAVVEVAKALPGVRKGRLAIVAAAALLIATEARAARAHAPHYRLYVSMLGGGDEAVSWYFPHCDFYDVGVREAVKELAGRAERGAEIASEVEWPVRYYAGLANRHDLVATHLSPGRACAGVRVCYVLTQLGREYFHNAQAMEVLAPRRPWLVHTVRGNDVVKVYRLNPGEALFPPMPR